MAANWDDEADLLVVGFGAAGAAAAIRGAQLGHSVLLIEKQAPDHATSNTRMSGGIIMAVNDVERATRYLDRCSGGMIPVEVSRAWAERAIGVVDWLQSIGADLDLHRIGGAEHPAFDGSDAIDCYIQGKPAPGSSTSLAAAGFQTGRFDPQRRTGRDLYASLRRVVSEKEGVRIRWSTKGQRLIQDGSSRVVGLEATSGAETVRLRGRAGVILTTGGYEFDEAMKVNYLKASPIHFYGNPDNTGDGIRMALAVGADLWHMNQMIGRAIGHFQTHDGTAQNFVLRIGPPGYILTDKHGRRFADEYPQEMMKHGFYYHLIYYDSNARDYPRIPCYWFFDQRRMKAGMLTGDTIGRVGVGLYDWSPDNRREIEQGWISEGTTIAEAAAIAGVLDPEQAAHSVVEYNAGCEGGNDAFGRPTASLIPLDQPPFYCVPMYPGGSNTCGGPRRNERSQILNAFGDVIPGLYAAGELGEAVGLLYPADGANLGEALCFGQIAAEAALSELDLNR